MIPQPAMKLHSSSNAYRAKVDAPPRSGWSEFPST